MVFAATKRFVGTPLEPLLHFYLPPVPPFTPTVLPPVRLRVNSCSLGSGELQTPITCASPSLPSGGSAWEKKTTGFWEVLLYVGLCLCVYVSRFLRHMFCYALSLSPSFILCLSYPHPFVCLLGDFCVFKNLWWSKMCCFFLSLLFFSLLWVVFRSLLPCLWFVMPVLSPKTLFLLASTVLVMYLFCFDVVHVCTFCVGVSVC